MQGSHRLRQILNMVNLSTPLGIGIAAATRSTVSRGPQGLLFASGYRPRLPAAAAYTIGNVVFFRQPSPQATASAALIGHEARHSTQYAMCLGLPFLPLYAAAAVWSLWRTGDPASRNAFERHAGLRNGGYAERPVIRHFPRPSWSLIRP